MSEGALGGVLVGHLRDGRPLAMAMATPIGMFGFATLVSCLRVVQPATRSGTNRM